jgi:hypothetical protein
MKKLSFFFMAFCIFIANSFPQSNYSVIGRYEKMLRDWGFIIRFEVRDLDTQVRIENASIELVGDNREIASVNTDRNGVGIFIFREDTDFPMSGLFRIVKRNHKFYEQSIDRSFLKSEKINTMIVLPNRNNWNENPLPSDDEIIRVVNTKNYKILATYSNTGYSGPGIFEYSINLEQIRNTSDQINYEPKEQPTERQEINVSSNSTSNRNNSSSYMVWDPCTYCWGGKCPECFGKLTVHEKKLKGDQECPVCHGKGKYVTGFFQEVFCTTCDGTGKVQLINGRIFPATVEEVDVPCPKCHGNVNWKCSHCNGTGYILRSQEGSSNSNDIRAYQDEKGNYILPYDMDKYYYNRSEGRYLLKP